MLLTMTMTATATAHGGARGAVLVVVVHFVIFLQTSLNVYCSFEECKQHVQSARCLRTELCLSGCADAKVRVVLEVL